MRSRACLSNCDKTGASSNSNEDWKCSLLHDSFGFLTGGSEHAVCRQICWEEGEKNRWALFFEQKEKKCRLWGRVNPGLVQSQLRIDACALPCLFVKQDFDREKGFDRVLPNVMTSILKNIDADADDADDAGFRLVYFVASEKLTDLLRLALPSAIKPFSLALKG